MTRGRLIVFEGLDGSGKTTQLSWLASALRGAGHPVVTTREPTGGAYGRRIRAMAKGSQRVAAEEELRWFVEDRREHVSRVIAPALARGEIVLSDRYYLSTVTYQGARGLDWAAILAQSEAEFPNPDLVLLLEIDPSLGLARVSERGAGAEPAFEEKDFLARVARLYHELPCTYLERLDARGEPERVREAVGEVVRRRLGLP
ncbi:MAG TPA: dTMP kinase [Myxococcota bacterium]|nr:dTMP kinase [Myxococcota bacterium]